MLLSCLSAIELCLRAQGSTAVSRSILSIISLESGFNEISRRRFAIYKWYAVGMLRAVYTSREDIVLNTILAVVSHIEVSGGVISKLLFWSREKEKLRGKYPEVKLKVHHHNSTPAARLCLWQIPTWVTFLSFAHGVLRSTSFKPLCRPKNVSFLNEQIALGILNNPQHHSIKCVICLCRVKTCNEKRARSIFQKTNRRQQPF